MWNFIKENWISLLALTLSVIGFFKDNIRDSINYIKTKKESKSAKLTVSYINEKLIISNKGQSNAMNVIIYVDDKEIQQHDVFGVFSRNIDFSLLTPNNSIGIKSTLSLGSKQHFKIKLIWDDNNSKNNISESIINI